MTKQVVGLVGCGAWGQHILRDLLAEGATVHVVARSDESRARAQAASSVVEAVSLLPPCDGYVVATSTSTHEAVIGELLTRQSPIFVEKPLVADLASARRIVDRANGLLFVMDKWRYHGGVRLLAELAASGRLGNVQGLVTIRRGWQGKPNPDTDALWHLAPHDLAIGIEVLGSIPEPISARAETTPDGKRITAIHAILGQSPWQLLDVSETWATHHREVRVIGTEAEVVLVGADSERVELRKRDGTAPPEPEIIPFENPLPLREEIRAFLAHLRGGPPPKSGLDDALAQIAALDRLGELAR